MEVFEGTTLLLSSSITFSRDSERIISSSSVGTGAAFSGGEGEIVIGLLCFRT